MPSIQLRLFGSNRSRKRWMILPFLLAVLTLPLFGQEDSTATKVDTTAKPPLNDIDRLRKTMNEFGRKERQKSEVKLVEGRIAIQQEEVISHLKRITLQARDFAKANIDTVDIRKDVEEIIWLNEIARDGVFTNTGTSQTHRNLTTTYNILNELHRKAEYRQEEVNNYRQQLIRYKFQIDSLTADSIIYEFPEDSAALVNYVSHLINLSGDISPADSVLKMSIEEVQGLQIQLNILVSSLSKSKEIVEASRVELSKRAFHREFANIWGKVGYSRPLKEIIGFSRLKGLLALKYYSSENTGKIFLTIAAIVALAIFFRSLRKQLVQANEFRADFIGQLVFRYPIYSAIMIGLNLLQFIFPNPPFIFSMILWIISMSCLTGIFRGFITNIWFSFWVIMCGLFLLACANNLMLQASRQERVWMVVLATAGVIHGLYFLLRGNKQELREKSILYFIEFVVILEFFSIVANVYGRYNLSKTLLTSGYVNVIIAIMFLWTVRLLDEVLSVASRIYKKNEKRLLYFDFERVGHKVPRIFYFLLILGWFVLFGRNFYAFRMISEPLRHMLVMERTVGNYSFSISNILVFFLIMLLATAISKIVSFFASDMNADSIDKSKSKVGSWLLLIRITIISLGVFFACAAAGVPFDRITLILGALGVGIGLGLQELTNSLVSGLIIAFEKPVNVGDIVEVAGQSGTMKSIGFRSSVVKTWDGAEVVIPNGVLLSSNLVNWTMSDQKRRVKLLVGVAYGTDLEQAKKLILEQMDGDSRILKYPNPAVSLVEFNSSSIDCKITFWVGNSQEWIAVRSDMILAIDLAFKEHNITIPFPQQDIYVHSLTESKTFNNANQSAPAEKDVENKTDS